MFRRFKILSIFALAALIALLAACTGEEVQAPANNADRMNDPGTEVDHEPPASQEEMMQRLTQASQVDKEELLGDRAVTFGGQLTYDPTQAGHLDLIQDSSIALTTEELGKLGDDGFVISGGTEFPTFTYGYHTIYEQDLPVYISADAIMFAVHKSYDDILKATEIGGLIPALRGLLESMRDELQHHTPAGFQADTLAEADFYLAVALSLLDGQAAAPVAGASQSDIDSFVDGATAHDGSASIELFGARRNVDFSQFKPRGHYTDSTELEQYFRAMQWLGRIDLRFLESTPDGELIFHRNQVEIAYLLHDLLDADAVETWRAIDEVLATFVGEQDNMSVDQFAPMLDELGVASPGELDDLSDQEIVTVIQKHGYGTQRILSHIMYNGMDSGSLPMNASFMLFGQRYVPDSHVFSNVVYDRVQAGTVERMMPDPLDVAFAALGNDHAVSLVEDELDRYPYAGDLNAMRVMLDSHGDDYWGENLYTSWLAALRALSPTDELADPAAHGLPQVTGTEAWARRILNTQLASWAELRHDTILYAKQSYTSGNTCEFPDAYVDPYPEFYQRLVDFAHNGRHVVEVLDPVVDDSAQLERIAGYFDDLSGVATTLGEMAEYQRTGTPFEPEHMAFVNEAVVVHWSCGGDWSEGWYTKLFYDTTSATEFDPTIADVHTQPTTAGGEEIGRIMHVATGSPRLTVVTADTCNGPRAYAGLVSSYFEKFTMDYERVNDEEWKEELFRDGTPDDVEWLQDIVVR